MAHLFVVRHCEPVRTDILLGSTDIPLGAEGLAHARRIWKGLELAALYTSPLLRARQTAEASGREAILVPEFAEFCFGDWEGSTERLGDAHLVRSLDGVAPRGGESWRGFVARVERGLERVRQGPLPAAVVGHLTVNSAVAQLLTGRDPVRYRQAYGEVIRYELE